VRTAGGLHDVKHPTKRERAANAATALSVPERLLLLCVASGMETNMLVKGLLECNSGGQLALTDQSGLYPNNRLPAGRRA
jgi:hypothetical protein